MSLLIFFSSALANEIYFEPETTKAIYPKEVDNLNEFDGCYNPETGTWFNVALIEATPSEYYLALSPRTLKINPANALNSANLTNELTLGNEDSHHGHALNIQLSSIRSDQETYFKLRMDNEAPDLELGYDADSIPRHASCGDELIIDTSETSNDSYHLQD